MNQRFFIECFIVCGLFVFWGQTSSCFDVTEPVILTIMGNGDDENRYTFKDGAIIQGYGFGEAPDVFLVVINQPKIPLTIVSATDEKIEALFPNDLKADNFLLGSNQSPFRDWNNDAASGTGCGRHGFSRCL